MSRPRGRPSRKNALDRGNLEEVLSQACDVVQVARALDISPVGSADYTLPNAATLTGAVPKNSGRRRALDEELNIALNKSTGREREEPQENSLMNKYKELKLEYENLRRENRQLQSRLEASELRMDALSNRFLDQIKELESKIHSETTEQVRSLRNVYEIRFQILGRLRDYVDRDTAASAANIERNTQDIRRVSLRQHNLEEIISGLNQSHPDVYEPSGTLKITPKNPVYEEKTSPVKFLEELKDFWAAVRPSRGQEALIISSCLQGTPRDWWDLVQEENDDFPQFVQKFKRRHWGEETQPSVKTKLELGSYRAGRDGSMAAYTIKMFREARGLTPALAVKEIISKIARHFNEEIRSTILGRPISTLKDLLELLERFDKYWAIKCL